MPGTLLRLFVVICLLVATLARGASAQAPAQNPPPVAPPTDNRGAVTRPSEEAPAKPPPSGAPTETPAVVIDGGAAATLLGKPVQSAKNEDLGRVVDVIVDRNGMMRAAIIDFGGFLGVGMRKIAVDWRALHFPEKGGMEKLIADLPRDHLRMAPVYKEGEPIVVIGGTIASPPAAAPPPVIPPPATPPAADASGAPPAPDPGAPAQKP